ncbi:MAG: hypothetical protein KAH57_11645 [Thermoplasmata archaeon]|nr:hypothetical protein [Thermoplasmata archaeon]
MPDIRKIITTDQGWIKKIQSSLPGYKKYRNCEDLRSADSLLRQELSSELEGVEKQIKESRNHLSRSMEMDLLNIIGELVNISHRVTEKVRHAQQGYSPWISADVRIEEDELNRLYEYDLTLFEEIDKLQNESDGLVGSCRSEAPDRKDKIASMKESIITFENIFDDRIRKITEVAQK